MRGARAAAPAATAAALAVVAAVHLGALLAGATTAVHVTKPALMPLLAAYVLARGGPRLLAVGLLFGCGGDTLLQTGRESLFLVGMGSFAVGHVCYLVLFARHGAAFIRRGAGAARTYRLMAAYAAVWVTVLALLWAGLEADLRVPVAFYSLLLTVMALGATRVGPWAAAGGVLFLLSDTLIAGGLAGWPQAPAPQFWIMLTYIAAQYLVAHGLLTHLRAGEERAKGAGRKPPGPFAARRGRQSWTADRASTMP
ncbi:lysoplasmalogenase [Streptomyces triculaminicus]|uniref:lysoplasmalogenase n=1 Tax=Streptomyces triculaminicus TaxID=2816232 RepID=UPI003F4D077A